MSSVALVVARVAARALDVATVAALLWTLIVLQALWFIDDLSGRVAPGPWDRAFVPTMLCAGGVLVYDTVFLARNRGQTPGRELCGLRVARSDGTPPAMRHAWAHALPAALVVAAPFGMWQALAVLAYAAPLARGGRRTLADLVAGTRTGRDDGRATTDRLQPVRPPFARRHRLFTEPSRLGKAER